MSARTAAPIPSAIGTEVSPNPAPRPPANTRREILYTRAGILLTLIGVVLHENSADNPNVAFVAARRLLNWGFRQT